MNSIPSTRLPSESSGFKFSFEIERTIYKLAIDAHPKLRPTIRLVCRRAARWISPLSPDRSRLPCSPLEENSLPVARLPPELEHVIFTFHLETRFVHIEAGMAYNTPQTPLKPCPPQIDLDQHLDEFVPSSQPLDDGVYDDYPDSVPTSQPFEDGDGDFPMPLITPNMAGRTVGLVGSFVSMKTTRWRDLRLNPPLYDGDRSSRLVRRVTAAPPIKKLPSLLIVSRESESSGPDPGLAPDVLAHQSCRSRQSQRRASASHLLRKMHALEAKLVRMRQKQSKILSKLSKSSSCKENLA
ncbi:hypothetical protein C8R44DRAFT_952537 [Mycena epipterygia]|nr:hypothetical protein C8R44DRAFT_952537 [Mycena epipterygia]